MKKIIQLFNKPYIIFMIFFMLLLCLICKEINNKTSIPYSSLILLCGFILSFF